MVKIRTLTPLRLAVVILFILVVMIVLAWSPSKAIQPETDLVASVLSILSDCAALAPPAAVNISCPPPALQWVIMAFYKGLPSNYQTWDWYCHYRIAWLTHQSSIVSLYFSDNQQLIHFPEGRWIAQDRVVWQGRGSWNQGSWCWCSCSALSWTSWR